MIHPGDVVAGLAEPVFEKAVVVTVLVEVLSV